MKFILTTFALLFVHAATVLAQLPPMLPNNPSQAPIDGGLSLVALAGGAYAWKKLKASKKA
jgi:hypothetical protein